MTPAARIRARARIKPACRCPACRYLMGWHPQLSCVRCLNPACHECNNWYTYNQVVAHA